MPEGHGAVVVAVGVEDAFGWWGDGLDVPRALGLGAGGTAQGEGRWIWEGPGPDGSERRWSAQLADKVRFQRLAWRASGNGLEQEGELRFRPVEGRTEVVLRLAYRFVDGGPEPFGEADVRRHVDEALARFKALVELGSGPPPEPEGDEPE